MANSASGHFSQVCCGFAAQGSTRVHPIDVNVSCDWTLDWNNLDNLVLTLSNLVFTGVEPINQNYYDWYLSCVSGEFVMNESGPVGGTTYATSSWYHVKHGSGNPSNGRADFSYNAGTIVWDIGPLERFSFDDDGNLDIWIGGCSTYSVTEPVYPESAKITLKSDTPIKRLMEWYPWQRMISGEWLSLNRDVGSLTSMKNGSWKDIKNSDMDRAEGFVYNNGWKKSPKSGNGA